MSLSGITLIIIRLFALHWFIFGFIHIVTSFINLQQVAPSSMNASFLIPGAILHFISGIAIWFLAPKLSKLVTKELDSEVSIQITDKHSLYTASLLAVGAYFALSSIGDVFNSIHHFGMNRGHQIEQIKGQSGFYELTKPIITLLAGTALMLGAGKVAKKVK